MEGLMKVFISWSGNTSKQLAESLKQWLPAVIQAAKPYYSPDDITKGARWSTEISKELEESMVGIICLTSDNLDAPWIMFEAGALSKRIDKSKVCPILFGVEPTDIQGPLVQFQGARFDKDEIKKVVRMMNVELADRGLLPAVFDEVFEMWWPKLKEKVDKILSEANKEQPSSVRSERDLLEEILKLTRATTLGGERIVRHASINPRALENILDVFASVIQELMNLQRYDLIRQIIREIRPALKHLIARIDAPKQMASILYDRLNNMSALDTPVNLHLDRDDYPDHPEDETENSQK
jgi:hypothetical protein